MLGGKNKQTQHPWRLAGGYTIVEVMIVLAVSGVIFLAAINFVNGKQERTAFSSGVNTMASQIQDVIEQVTDGQYNDEPITCTPTSPGNPLNVVVGAGAGAQGTQPACVFLGKSFIFTSGSTNTFSAYPVAGLRTSGGNEVTDLGSAQITRIDSLVTSQSMSQNLSVAGIADSTSGGIYKPAGQIEFLQSLAQAGDVSGVLSNGAQTVGLYYSPDPSTLSTTSSSGVSICLTDGTRYGIIDIGLNSNNGGTLNVNVASTGTTACKTS